jgi:hypothetical protein
MPRRPMRIPNPPGSVVLGIHRDHAGRSCARFTRGVVPIKGYSGSRRSVAENFNRRTRLAVPKTNASLRHIKSLTFVSQSHVVS